MEFTRRETKSVRVELGHGIAVEPHPPQDRISRDRFFGDGAGPERADAVTDVALHVQAGEITSAEEATELTQVLLLTVAGRRQ